MQSNEPYLRSVTMAQAKLYVLSSNDVNCHQVLVETIPMADGRDVIAMDLITASEENGFILFT
jgi:hypothetical protein